MSNVNYGDGTRTTVGGTTPVITTTTGHAHAAGHTTGYVTETPVRVTETSHVTHASSGGTSHHDYQLQAVPRDRVRWGPVLAGLFTAVATLAVLAVLGIAVGLSSVDGDDSPRAFGIGAGVWSIVSGILAFLIGGYVAAATAATPASVGSGGKLRDDNGLLQGAMVWIVAIPLSVYLVAGGIGSALGLAGRAAGSAAQTAATAAGPTAAAAAQDTMNKAGGAQNAADRAGDKLASTTQQAAGAASDAIAQVRDAVTPQNVERVAGAGAKGAWGTLISMVVGLLAASVGGFVGGKSRTAVVRG